MRRILPQDIKGLLFQVPIPYSSGLPFGSNTIRSIVVDMSAQGIEFNVSVNVLDKSAFKWSSSFNITTNSNKLVAINEVMDAKGHGIISGLTWNKKNARVGAFYLAEYAGVDPAKGITMIYEIDQSRFVRTNETVKTGNIIPATTANVTNNKIFHQKQTGLPTYFRGFIHTFSFRNFELLSLLTFQGGNCIYNQAEGINTNIAKGGNNLNLELIENTWTKAGDNAAFPQLTL